MKGDALKGKTLILGNGFCAEQIATDLLAEGIDIIVATGSEESAISSGLQSSGSGTVETLTGAKVVSCEGCSGDYELVLNTSGGKLSRRAANIIVAEESVREANFSIYGLTPASPVLSLGMARQPGESPDPGGTGQQEEEKIVFLTGLTMESHPVILEEIMRACQTLQQKKNTRTYVLTGNLKVAAHGLEQLYCETKKNGTVYIKFQETVPEIRQEKDGRVCIQYFDETIRSHFSLTPDRVVVDEAIRPAASLEELARIFKLDRDQNGFIQSSNVHRLSVLTNRKGIFAAGPSRAVQSQEQQAADAENAVLSVLMLSGDGMPVPGIRAEINPGGCVRCLTCIRSCPFGAIKLDTKPAVMQEACEGCGICASECPRSTIRLGEAPEAEGESQAAASERKAGAENLFPEMIVFACSRSAGRAKTAAAAMGIALPEGLKMVEVPCAGSISQEHILGVLNKGADGVLLLTCHQDNCHSEKGNQLVGSRAEVLSERLGTSGFETQRIAVSSLASNMGRAFGDLVTGFEKEIQALGPSRLKG
jgi:quinone-modifying oxidoreductase subunit QmoB